MNREHPMRRPTPPARYAIRHGSGFCVVDVDVLREAVRVDIGDYAADTQQSGDRLMKDGYGIGQVPEVAL